MPAAIISASHYWLPPDSVSNDELVASYNAWVERWNAENAEAIASGEKEAAQPSSSDFIETRSGIKNRHYVDKQGVLDPARLKPRIARRGHDELGFQAEFALKAVRPMLESVGRAPEDIDAVIVACSNQERPYPSVAVEIVNALGSPGFGFDMNTACASATFAGKLANDMIAAGSVKSVLVCSPELMSPQLDFRDRGAHFIFGDTSACMLIESEERASRGWEILSTKLGSQWSNAIRNDFGFLERDREPVPEDQNMLTHVGPTIFKDVVPLASRFVSDHLKDAGIDPSNVSRFWLHQANARMNELIAKKITGEPYTHDRAPMVLEDIANTSSAGAVVAFSRHNEDLESGSYGVLSAFGAGYAIGSLILKKR